MNCRPISPNLGLWVTAWAGADEPTGLERFARLFRNVFRAIPAADGGLLLHHWATVCRGRPTIELVGRDEYLSAWLAPAAAWVSPAGNIMRFRRHYMDSFHDGLVSATIAHELGHVYAAALGLTFATEEKSEQYADVCAACWNHSFTSGGQIYPEPTVVTPPTKKKSKLKKKKKEKFSYV
jgi:hypothetical protein